jgi:hypothetical protein
VLTVELANQDALALAYNEDHASDSDFTALEIIGAKLFVNRENTVDKSELPVINIITPEINYSDENTAFTSVGDNKYYIEIYTGVESNETESGDVASSRLLERIVGMIRSILMNNQWQSLDFSERFIKRRWVASYTRTRPRIAADAENIISGVIEIHYEAEETTELTTGVVERLLTTVVKLSNTEKGYQFII